MTWRDTLEIGLKKDARFRKDNLPAGEVHGPEIPNGPGRSADIPDAHDEKTVIAPVPEEPPSPPREPAPVIKGRE